MFLCSQGVNVWRRRRGNEDRMDYTRERNDAAMKFLLNYQSYRVATRIEPHHAESIICETPRGLVAAAEVNRDRVNPSSLLYGLGP